MVAVQAACEPSHLCGVEGCGLHTEQLLAMVIRFSVQNTQTMHAKFAAYMVDSAMHTPAGNCNILICTIRFDSADSSK